MDSTRICPGCETEFVPPTGRGRHQKYCSERCGQNYYDRVARARVRDDLVLPELKRCTKCGETKPSSSFPRDNGRKDGLKFWCKGCERIYHANHYDPEYQKARWKRYYSDPAIREHANERRRQYNKENYDLVQSRQAEYARRHAPKRHARQKADYESKIAWLHDEKFRRGCSICGERHPACLDFHHIDPAEKSFNISDFLGKRWSVEKVLPELEKCLCLCSNCHRIHHWGNRNGVGRPLQAVLPLLGED